MQQLIELSAMNTQQVRCPVGRRKCHVRGTEMVSYYIFSSFIPDFAWKFFLAEFKLVT